MQGLSRDAGSATAVLVLLFVRAAPPRQLTDRAMRTTTPTTINEGPARLLRDGGVTVLHLYRPDALNAIDAPTEAEAFAVGTRTQDFHDGLEALFAKRHAAFIGR